MANFMADIGSLLGTNAADIVKNSTSRKGNTELNMDDFLQLMIVQLTNQTIDDTMDTSEMMNQMLQMQMITAMTNTTYISIQSYANSLVNQVVTVGVVNGNVLEERAIKVMGTGTYNGQQVIFGSDGNMYYLSQIMAVGLLPNEDGTYGPQKPSEGEGDGEGGGVEGSEGVEGDGNGNTGNEGGDVGGTEEAGGATGSEGAGGSGSTENPDYNGEQGVPSD